MNSSATGRNLRISPLKMRRIINKVRGKNVKEALYILKALPDKGARMAYKVIFSAASNFKNRFPETGNTILKVEAIFADQAPVLRRVMPRARGRADILRKQSCHLSVVLSGLEENKEAR
jgi:large subunit ribosomal protein L22